MFSIFFRQSFQSAFKPSAHYPESNGANIFEFSPSEKKNVMRSQRCAKVTAIGASLQNSFKSRVIKNYAMICEHESIW